MPIFGGFVNVDEKSGSPPDILTFADFGVTGTGEQITAFVLTVLNHNPLIPSSPCTLQLFPGTAFTSGVDSDGNISATCTYVRLSETTWLSTHGGILTFDANLSAQQLRAQITGTPGPATVVDFAFQFSIKGNLDYPETPPPPHGSHPPAAPTGLVAIKISPTLARLTWVDNSDNELGFAIERSDGSGFSQLGIVSSNTNTYDDTTVEDPLSQYTWRVYAYGSEGVSAYSNEATIPEHPVSISPEIGSVKGGTTVTIAWEDLQDGATVTIDEEDVDLNAAQFVTPAHIVGTVDVVITNPDTSSGTVPFLYFAPPVIQPTHGRLAGGTLVTIRRASHPAVPDGSEFVSGALVSFGGIDATDVTFVDVDTYTCVAPAFPARGTVTVRIINLDSRLLTMDLEDAYFYGDTIFAPRVRVSADQIAHGPLPSTVTLIATVEGGILEVYRWAFSSGPEVPSISSPNSLTTNVVFSIYTPGVYTFKFTASDADNIFPSISAFAHIIMNSPRIPQISITGETT